MNIKVTTLIVFLAIISFSLLIFSLTKKPTKPSPSPSTIPVFSPSPSTLPEVSLTPTQQTELQAQSSWEKDQQKIIQQNPWYLKLPLISDQYFLSYNPSDDSVLATIYYHSKSSQPKNDQLAASKQATLTAINNLSSDLANKKVVYFETDKDK